MPGPPYHFYPPFATTPASYPASGWKSPELSPGIIASFIGFSLRFLQLDVLVYILPLSSQPWPRKVDLSNSPTYPVRINIDCQAALGQEELEDPFFGYKRVEVGCWWCLSFSCTCFFCVFNCVTCKYRIQQLLGQLVYIFFSTQCCLMNGPRPTGSFLHSLLLLCQL